MPIGDKVGEKTIAEFFDRLNALLAGKIVVRFMGKEILAIDWEKPSGGGVQ